MTAPTGPTLPLLLLGGLLGPFGGGVVSTMLPAMAADLDTTIGVAGGSMTSYLIVFALAQLVSGTWGERWGRRRTVRWAYVAFAVTSVLCALAPNAPLLLAARALQGLANAFITPLLLAGLAELVAPERLSRTVGVFGAFQAAGQSMAPLFGGLAQLVDWRWAFWLIALVAAVLACFPPPGGPRRGATAPRFAALVTWRVARLSLVGASTYLGAAGLPFLVSLLLMDDFGTGPTAAGLVLAGFGLAGIATAAWWGRWVARRGPALTGAVGMLGGGLLVLVLPQMPGPVGVAVVWAVVGSLSTLATVALQNLALRETPGNPGGTVSVVSSFRFGGAALAPLVFLPLYAQGTLPAFGTAAVVSALGAGLLLSLRPRRRRPPSG